MTQVVNKKVKLILVGLESNAFSLLGAFRRQARREGWTQEEIEKVTQEATSGDYDHLLVTLSYHCENSSFDEDYEDDEESDDYYGE